ncbi:preprotein translocase subunit SecG [candidate division GN15 bacterium]|nr:preprotein translocase subunit SecG [candidate division GN15 bacterium]
MFTTWVVFHVIICIALVLVVLMQSSKGGGLSGSMFGGGGGGGMGGAVFGGRGATSFLSKATTVLAVIFMLNCGALAYMSSRPTGQAGGGVDMDSDSPITRQAQEERQRFMEQQERQQVDQAPGSDTAAPIQITPSEAADTAGATGGGN